MGCPDVCLGTPLMTEPLLKDRTANEREVSMNNTAEAVVSFVSSVAVPLLPKRVWLEPPNAAPISAPLLLWIRTMNIRNAQTTK